MLPMILVFTASLSIVSLSLVQSFKQSDFVQIQNQHRIAARLVKESLLAVTNNDAAWSETIRQNTPALDCLRTNGADCGAGAFGNIKVYNADGTVLIDNSAPEGFDLAGRRCLNFDPINGHDTCVFKFTVSATCDGGPCGPTQMPLGTVVAGRPRILIQSTLQFKPSLPTLATALNTTLQQYNLNFVRGNFRSSLAKYCASLDGIFDSKTMSCQAAGTESASFDCRIPPWGGPGYYFVGFFADGSPKCKLDVRYNVGCTAITAVTGWRADGSLICQGY